MQELVNSLTENKLADATKLEDLTKKIAIKENCLKELQSQLVNFNDVSIENESLKRQVQRLSDENDSLLSQMEETTPVSGTEEQRKQIDILTVDLVAIQKQYEEKTHETKSLQGLLDNSFNKIKRLIQENSDLKFSVESQNDLVPSDQIKIKFDKCINKLKLYRGKICEISEKFKLLKADREILITTTKDYSRSVSHWQTEIATASSRMIDIIKKSTAQIRAKDEEIKDLREEIENLKLSSTAVSSDEVLEAELLKLKEVVKLQEKRLEEEKEAQKKLRQAVKKTSVLDLEMEAYEKTLDEMNKKLEVKEALLSEIEKTVKVQNETMESLKGQIESLEANLEAEKTHSVDIKNNLDSQLNLLRKTEHERTDANLQLELLNKNYETLKLENGEIKLDMAKQYGDLEKRYQVLGSERNDLLKNIAFLENEVDEFKKLSFCHDKEIECIRSEFASYKIRAQSVLRQSQTKDLSKEQELQDEILTTQKTIDNLKNSNARLTHELKTLKKNYNDINEDKTRLQIRCKDLLETHEKQSDEVLEESRRRSQQHEESIKAYQLQIETLNAFYKKKVHDSEESHQCAITQLHDKVTKLENASLNVPVPIQATNLSSFDSSVYTFKSEEQKLNILMIDREEAEGSEDQSSQSSTFHLQHRRKISKGRELMPLDELLNSSFDDNSNEVNEETISNFSSPLDALEHLQSKLSKEENRVAHLTTLLADSEKDLARMQQLNELLKEEVRRQQRNFDREEHIQNSEYLKNIIIKFLTLNNGDEKQRLIPVLNTILKLSRDENNLLQNACKSGWAAGLWAK